MSYFFNAPIQIPNGSNLAISNILGNKLFFNSNSTMSSSYELVFPAGDGSSGQALITDGNGNLRFDTVTGSSSNIASNAIINSTSGDIAFTTDSGNTTIGSDTSNLTLKGNDARIKTTLINNNTSILFGNNGDIDTSNVATYSFYMSNSSVNSSRNVVFGTSYTNNNSNYFTADSETKIIEILSNVSSTSFNTGSLVIGDSDKFNSGLGVYGNVNVGQSVDITENLVVDGTSTLTGIVSAGANVDVSGNVNVTKSIDVSQNLVVDGTSTLGTVSASSLTLSGDLTVNGTTTTINSNVTTVDDPVIQLGVAGVADSFDRGIRGEYNDGSDKSLFFGWDRSENYFTFIPEATYTSSNIATGTVGDAKFYNMDLSGNVTVDGTATLTGIVSASANVDVSGNVNVTKSVDITQNLVVDGTSTLTGIVSAGANVDVTGNVNVTKSVDVTENLVVDGTSTMNGKMVVSVNEFDSSVGSTTDIWNGSNSAANKHLMTNATGLSNYSSSGSYTTGQMMNIFYTNNSGGTASANLDFGASSLYTGSGTARYLLFNTTGQSASLIYIDASGDNDGWRIINTGAEVH
jgi:cytoskeletal protein CcmA (bactofilin family)